MADFGLAAKIPDRLYVQFSFSVSVCVYFFLSLFGIFLMILVGYN